MAALISAKNIFQDALVEIRTNFFVIEGTANPEPPTYISDEIIDLSEDGSYVVFDNNYKLGNQYIIKLKIIRPKKNATIFSFIDTNGFKGEIIYCEKKFDTQLNTVGYCVLKVYGELTYVINSNYIDPISGTDSVCVFSIGYNNGIYRVTLNNTLIRSSFDVVQIYPSASDTLDWPKSISITSKSQLDEFIEENSSSYLLNLGFTSAVNDYNSNYFNNGCLILLLFETPNSAVETNIISFVTTDENLIISVKIPAQTSSDNPDDEPILVPDEVYYYAGVINYDIKYKNSPVIINIIKGWM